MSIEYFSFFISTLLVIFFAEKGTTKVIRSIFKGHIEEMEKEEKMLAEYYESSFLAAVSQNKEAFDGFQEMIAEAYWKLFFRKLIIGSSVFFVILSPYMVFSQYLMEDVISSPFTTVFMIAIVYFMAKSVYQFALKFGR